PSNAFSWVAFWNEAQFLTVSYWRDFIVNYSPDRQNDLVFSLWSYLMATPKGTQSGGPWTCRRLWLPALPLAVASFWLIWRRRRHHRPVSAAQASSVVFYRRFLAIVAQRMRLRPLPAQTPREFGALVAEHLRNTAVTMADVPAAVIGLLYEVRYGCLRAT